MSADNTSLQRTDWDTYYRQSPTVSRFTRSITRQRIIRAITTHSIGRPTLVEFGGAGSCILDSVMKTVQPTEYHVVDNNQYGLNLLHSRAQKDSRLFLYHQDILNLTLDIEVDIVLSVGLIEHFDPSGTERAVQAHLRILKSGGIAIITFPTPTFLYRATRKAAEFLGKWRFHDERPLFPAEVVRAVSDHGAILSKEIIWPIFLTQTLLVVRKN
jgi:SAM-dependent methyltransferase